MTTTQSNPHTSRASRSTWQLAAAGALLALVLAACGSEVDDTVSTQVDEAVEAADTDEVQEAPAAVVTTGSTDLGDVLVDAAGLTLYGFTNDADGLPTCEDACADAWPAVEVENADLPEGLDSAVFSVVERSDGTFQLKAGDWPLYTFSGDAAPGETNGQGSGDVWFAAAPDGGLIMDDTAQAVEVPADEVPVDGGTADSAPAGNGYGDDY